jgi:hypothetical protein
MLMTATSTRCEIYRVSSFGQRWWLQTTSGYTLLRGCKPRQDTRYFDDAFRQRMARVQGLFSREDGPNGPTFPDFPSTGRIM